MSGRRVFIGGNWKSNGTKKSIQELISKLNQVDIPSNTDVVVAPTYIHLDMVKQTIQPKIKVSAQNINHDKTGAFTGEIAAETLADFGIEWTIIGHSERRQIYHTSDEMVAKQITNAQTHKLHIIACVGETLDQRKANETISIVTSQLDAIAKVVTDWSKIVIAYEPVWAIGTGVVATPDQAQEVHDEIRKYFSKKQASIAQSIQIIYGGSVNGKNCDELLTKKDVDGFLVGGASLKADDFKQIMTSASRVKKGDN